MNPYKRIPCHITALYVFAVVNLVALLNIALVDANVVVSERNVTLNELPDLAARFGQAIPEEPIVGHLVYVKPRDGCKLPQPPPTTRFTRWIALIRRGGCDFDLKVLNAQKQGYIAAIIHNNESDDLVPMGGGKYGRNVNISAVFVGQSSGTYLAQTDRRLDIVVAIDARSSPESPIAYLASIGGMVLACFLVSMVVLVVRWVRDLRKKRRSRLSAAALKKIPTKKFKKGDQYDMCAICLDEYEEGEKLRILPCSHTYHLKCIDPWLTKNKRSCPICKRKVIPGDRSDSDSDQENGNEAPSETTPLLPGGGASSINGSTFDSSRLPGSSLHDIPYSDSSSEGSVTPSTSIQQSSVEVHSYHGSGYGTTATVMLANEIPADSRSIASQTEEPQDEAAVAQAEAGLGCHDDDLEPPGAVGGIKNQMFSIVEDHFNADPLMGAPCGTRRASDSTTDDDGSSDDNDSVEVDVIDNNSPASSNKRHAANV